MGKKINEIRTQLVLAMLALLWLTMLTAAWSEAAESSAGDLGGEYNFTWLDPDKKIYVLQNRRYTKANKLFVSAMVGPGFSNPYRSSYNLDPRIAYYFSEALGFEAFYGLTSNSGNNTFDALQRASPNTWPLVREIRSQYGLLVHWVPWYAKINVFNKILYL
ncbi:MAG: hypothetical protein AABZ06_03800, partial [Bdellovibrionota bacterium]